MCTGERHHQSRRRKFEKCFTAKMFGVLFLFLQSRCTFIFVALRDRFRARFLHVNNGEEDPHGTKIQLFERNDLPSISIQNSIHWPERPRIAIKQESHPPLFEGFLPAIVRAKG